MSCFKWSRMLLTWLKRQIRLILKWMRLSQWCKMRKTSRTQMQQVQTVKMMALIHKWRHNLQDLCKRIDNLGQVWERILRNTCSCRRVRNWLKSMRYLKQPIRNQWEVSQLIHALSPACSSRVINKSNQLMSWRRKEVSRQTKLIKRWKR